MDVDLVLAPVDCSDAAERAVEYAVAIARRYDATLHLLHVLDERAVQRLESGDLAADSVAEDHRAFSEDVEARLEDVDLHRSSAAGFSVQRLSRTPGSVILDSAEELDADLLVVPRQTPSDRPDETIGKAALYVLEYASQPVLSV